MRFSLSLLVFGLMAACAHTNKGPVSESKTTPVESKMAEQTKAAEPVATAAAGIKVECSTKGDSRVLELRAKGKGCEVAYTKNGQEGIVASAANGTAHCEATLNKIRDRLKGSGFECK